MSVLIVDDQPLNRVVAGQLLRSLNLHVIEACNGREGLQKYLECGRSVAFIFLDLMMPVLDGFNAAMSIRSAETVRGWLPVPIVAFTSEDVRHGTPMFHRVMASGFNDVVPKPMNRRLATQLLRRWLPSLDSRPLDSSSGASSDEDAACGWCEGQASCSRCSRTSFAATASAATAAAGSSASTGAHLPTGNPAGQDGSGSGSAGGGSSSSDACPAPGHGGSSAGGSTACSSRRPLPQ